MISHAKPRELILHQLIIQTCLVLLFPIDSITSLQGLVDLHLLPASRTL